MKVIITNKAPVKWPYVEVTLFISGHEAASLYNLYNCAQIAVEKVSLPTYVSLIKELVTALDKIRPDGHPAIPDFDFYKTLLLPDSDKI